MARPRTPIEKARLTGALARERMRFASRTEPIVEAPLGDPPEWLVDMAVCHAREAWYELAVEIPWLNSSHRALVAIASGIRGRMMAGGEVGVSALNLLRQTLGQMGASPADAAKVSRPATGGPDPAEKYFQ